MSNTIEASIQKIGDEISFSKPELLSGLLYKSIHLSNAGGKESYSEYPDIIFKLETFLKGFSPFNNELGKNKKYKAASHALSCICKELAIEVEDSECFILYHIRDLGKFRMREDKLLLELEKEWISYPEFKIEKSDFIFALKNLMRKKFITYRRGNLHLNPSVLVRYRP